MTGFDIFDGDIGLFAAATEGGAALLLTGGDELSVWAAESGSPPLSFNGRSLEANLTPSAVKLTIEGELNGHLTASLCNAAGTLRGEGAEQELDCPAVSIEGGAPADGLAMTRRLVIVLGDGSLLVIAGARRDADGEAEVEEVRAAHAHADGSVTQFEEPLLSTEFGPDRVQRRATLELWPAEDSGDRLLRGAGNRITGDSIVVGDRTHDVSLFSWSVGGIPGLGRYEIARALDP